MRIEQACARVLRLRPEAVQRMAGAVVEVVGGIIQFALENPEVAAGVARGVYQAGAAVVGGVGAGVEA
eukprot:SAG22_NODE_13208_length_414_cov_1.634921_1_plen_67_part_01